MTAKKRLSFAHNPQPILRPDLTQLQHNSFEEFVDTENGLLRKLFDETGEIENSTSTVKVELKQMYWGDAPLSERECKTKDTTFSRPLHVDVILTHLDTGEIKEQRVFFGDMPWMTKRGTFLVGGTERVIINQIIRSPGAYIMPAKDNKKLLQASLMPARGSWLGLELDRKGRLQVQIDRKRRFPYTVLMSAIGFSKEQVLEATDNSIYVQRSYEEAGEHTLDQDAARIEIFKKQRPGDPPSVEEANNLINNLFFNERRYDLSKVGRYKLNQRLGSNVDENTTTLHPDDLLNLLKAFIEVPRALGLPEDEDAPVDLVAAARGLSFSLIDDIVDEYEHFANRRVRAVGELVQDALRVGWQRSERAIRERLMLQEPDAMTPQSVINVRPLIAGLKEFFGSSQLSQFMDQDNALSGLIHRRRLSSLGPGGLTRDRAPLEVRDVHPTHYGRMCPIETPEGPNIGLIGSLTSYASINNYGFLTTPYKVVKKGVVTEEIAWFDAGEEAELLVAPASTIVENGKIVEEEAIARTGGGKYVQVAREEIGYIDLTTDQLWSVSTSLIPFLEHDDANRALMGSNMQRQSVPLLRPSSPLVGTGMEAWIGRDSGDAIFAAESGEVSYTDAKQIVIQTSSSEDLYELDVWERSNQGTLIHQRPCVKPGQKVEKGDLLADGSSTDNGELALGRNLTVAFMPWEGYNFEDSIILSQKVVEKNLLTSVHIESYEIESRNTKQGDEEITRDIPNRSEESLRNLDEKGIIRVGAKVGSGDLLVGKVAPKGDTDPSAEERLIRAIFREQAREVRDVSLKVPHGEGGVVIDVKTFSRKNGDDLQPGVHELIRVFVAQRRHIREGDKLAGRHGNKGVVSKIVPVQDMPHLPDGTAVDIILNPLGVPSRMNIGQILETHLGWVALNNGFSKDDDSPQPVETPVFNGASLVDVDNALLSLNEKKPEMGMVLEPNRPEGAKATGTFKLYNGRTGEPFDRPITVGVMYILKLHHLVDDKIHARSTGPYSLITQQPLGGKAQFGGQRFGEMEVWALEAYGAAYTLQEMLTIKSDDIVGRVKSYESIVKGENIEQPSVPESFRVLVKEMQALGLKIDLIAEEIDEEDLLKQQEEENAFLQAAEDLAFSMAGIKSDEDPQASDNTTENATTNTTKND